MAHVLEILAFLRAKEVHIEPKDLQNNEQHEQPRTLFEGSLSPLD